MERCLLILPASTELQINAYIPPEKMDVLEKL